MSNHEGTMVHPRRGLKNEGSMVQTCRYIDMSVVKTDIYMLRPKYIKV